MATQAVVTKKPVLIDPTTFATCSKPQAAFASLPTGDLSGAHPGLRPCVFRYGTGSTFFMALDNANPANQSTGPAGVFKTTDGGVTWTRLDAANQPALGSGLTCHYPGGDTLYLAFADAGGAMYINTFSFLNGTWGTATVLAPGGKVYDPTKGGIHITRLSNGDLYLYSTIPVSATRADVFFWKYSGGAWTGPTALAANGANKIYNIITVITDSNDITHTLCAFSDKVGLTFDMKYVQVSAVGVAAAEVEALTQAQMTFAGQAASQYGNPQIFNGNIRIPMGVGNNLTSNQVQMIVGTGLVAPVWTIDTGVDPGATTTPAPSQYGSLASVVTTNRAGVQVLWEFWIVTNTTADAAPQQIWRNCFTTAGGWMTPQLVYDYSVNPSGTVVYGSGIGNYLIGLSVAAGSFLLISGMPSTVSVGAGSYAGFALIAPDPPASSQLAFYGVRRIKDGAESDPAKSKYKYYEKVYRITASFTITSAYTSAQPLLTQGQRVTTRVDDYDFELRHITKFVTDGNGVAVTSPSPFAIILYDSNVVARMNAPLLAELLCDDPNIAGISRNFWPSPPIMYRVNSSIIIDVFTLVAPGVVLPVTVNLLFDGVRRIPCV